MLNVHVRDNYFLPLKLCMVLIMECNIILDSGSLSGAAGLVLLFSAFFFVGITGIELVKGKKKYLFLSVEVLSVILLSIFAGEEFVVLFTIFLLDFASARQLKISWYFMALSVIFFTEYARNGNVMLVILLLVIIYIQHSVVIHSYKEQMKDDEQTEQNLKRNLMLKESMYKEEIGKSLLSAENNMLEEKTRLAQVLHDKLGHSINGSVYQLEACKVLLNQDTEACQTMIQAVIDNLRGSMDEIRKILRRELPDKQKLTMLQLHSMCADCEKVGIEANLSVQGEMSEIPENFLEILLDNACEAISNALKYSKCTKIDIQIVVMNRMLRCTISDNGVGCENVVDGMGLSGMRKRMRSVNGILDFKTDMGFTINMLLPLEEK